MDEKITTNIPQESAKPTCTNLELFSNLDSIPSDFKEMFDKFIGGFAKLIKDKNIKNLNIGDYLKHIFENKENLKTQYAGGKSDLMMKIFNELIKKAYSEQQIVPDNFKDEILDKYSGQVIFGAFDLKNSTDDPNFKDKFGDMLWLNDIFEHIFKDEGFKLFATEGDCMYLGFFKDNIDERKKILILQLFKLILDAFGIEVNTFFDSFKKEQGENITRVSATGFDTTIMSNEFSHKVHNFATLHKKGNHPNAVNLDLLKWFLDKQDYKKLKEESFSYLNVNISNLFTLNEIKSLLSYNDYLNVIFGTKQEKNDFFKALKNIYLQNKEKLEVGEERQISNIPDLKENTDIVELLKFNKDTNIIEIGQESEYIFFFILDSGSVEIKDFGGQTGYSITLDQKGEIVGEMSLFNDKATATVIAHKGSKLLKIPKKHIKQILGLEEGGDKIIMDIKYRKVLETYILDLFKNRNNYNNNLLALVVKSKNNFGYLEYYKFKIWLKSLLEGDDLINSENKVLIEKQEKNDCLFLVKAGSMIEMKDKNDNSKKFKLLEDTIFGEGSLVNNKSYKPSKSIKLIKGSYKQLDIPSVKDKIKEKDKNFLSIISKYIKLRNNTNAVFI